MSATAHRASRAARARGARQEAVVGARPAPTVAPPSGKKRRRPCPGCRTASLNFFWCPSGCAPFGADYSIGNASGVNGSVSPPVPAATSGSPRPQLLAVVGAASAASAPTGFPGQVPPSPSSQRPRRPTAPPRWGSRAESHGARDARLARRSSPPPRRRAPAPLCRTPGSAKHLRLRRSLEPAPPHAAASNSAGRAEPSASPPTRRLPSSLPPRCGCPFRPLNRCVPPVGDSLQPGHGPPNFVLKHDAQPTFPPPGRKHVNLRVLPKGSQSPFVI